MRSATAVEKVRADPYFLRVETIRDLCGSRIPELSQFRPTLRLALNRLVAVGFLKSWNLDRATDQVSVVLAPQGPAMLLPDETALA